MTKNQYSWQGIGISSDPNQKDGPYSLHLLAYLIESSRTSDEHLIIVADSMQIDNYQTLYGLSEREAEKIAVKKGKAKKRNLESILRANRINNVVVKRLDEVVGENEREIIEQIKSLYGNDERIREKVLETVPKRLKDKAENLNIIANYALTEIRLILALLGIKFGHEREKVYDEVAEFIHKEYGIGKKPEFQYSELGLEYVPGTGRSVEPYSSYSSDGRFLLTDSQRVFGKKRNRLTNKQRRHLKNLEQGLNQDLDQPNFYKKAVKPTYDALRKPFRIARNIALATVASIALIVSGGAYVHHDTHEIRQAYINNIPGFVFSGEPDFCEQVVNGKIIEANKDIQEKYFIPNYF